MSIYLRNSLSVLFISLFIQSLSASRIDYEGKQVINHELGDATASDINYHSQRQMEEKQLLPFVLKHSKKFNYFYQGTTNFEGKTVHVHTNTSRGFTLALVILDDDQEVTLKVSGSALESNSFRMLNQLQQNLLGHGYHVGSGTSEKYGQEYLEITIRGISDPKEFDHIIYRIQDIFFMPL